MQKTNRDYPFIVNAQVTEWDIRQANVSLMEYYGLAEPKLIEKLRDLPKQQREEAVGKLYLKRKEFGKQLEQSFNDIINEFMEANHLTFDDVVSVKKDAIFVKNHAISKSTFGNTVTFVPKNTYRHVLLLPLYEIYMSDDKTDVKGISDEKLPLHEAGMLFFLRNVMYSAHDQLRLDKYFKDFVNAYKKKELDYDMYREFSSSSTFTVRQDGNEMVYDEITEEDMPFLDISFNYINVVMPTIQATF